MKQLIIFIYFTCMSFIIRAQDCGSIYYFNSADKTSYAISCGEVGEEGWIVSKNSCNFYTPLTSNTDEEEPKWIDIRSVFNGTDNLDARDFVWIFYYVNGNTVKTSTIKGEFGRKSYDFSDSLLIPAGGSFRFRIAMVCDEADEKWELGNRQLSICTRAKAGQPAIEQIPATSKIEVNKDRGIAQLKWSAEPGTSGNYFKIERSANGEKFEFAGFVKENNPAAQLSYYSFIDAGTFKPQSWYKISRVTNSGEEVVFGEIVSVKF